MGFFPFILTLSSTTATLCIFYWMISLFIFLGKAYAFLLEDFNTVCQYKFQMDKPIYRLYVEF